MPLPRGPRAIRPYLTTRGYLLKSLLWLGGSQDRMGRCFVVFLLNGVCPYLSVCIL